MFDHEEQEPRGSDICPNCDSGNTAAHPGSVPFVDPYTGLPAPWIFWICRDCRVHWWVVGVALFT